MNKAVWHESAKIAIAKVPDAPTSGKAGAIAAIVFLMKTWDDKRGAQEQLGELLVDVSTNKVEDGFLSNASAMAKAVGVKTSATSAIDVSDLLAPAHPAPQKPKGK